MMLRSLALALVLCLTVLPNAQAQSLAAKVDYVGTSRHITVTGLMRRDVNGFINLAVELTNSDYDDQEGYYRLTWVDDGGFPVWEEEAWKPVLLHGNEKKTVLVVSPTNRATDFKIVFSGERNWAGPTGPRP